MKQFYRYKYVYKTRLTYLVGVLGVLTTTKLIINITNLTYVITLFYSKMLQSLLYEITFHEIVFSRVKLEFLTS
jgi:hypothetical protein